MPPTEAHNQIEIVWADGLHLRLAAQFARLACQFRADVRLHHRGKVADGKSVLGLLSLVAERGSLLDLEARGSDAEQAVEALTGLLVGCSVKGADGQGMRANGDGGQVVVPEA